MNLQFNKNEQSAIFFLAKSMILADGRIDDEETSTLTIEMLRIGVKPDQLMEIEQRANTMNPADAIITISNFDDDEKKYVTAFLGSLMAVDGKVDDSEMKLWGLVSTLCGLPEMNVLQALHIMSTL